MDTKIYHNPKCSKSRQTLQILKENAEEPGIVEYLTNPPNKDELVVILDLLGLQARQLMRQGEKIYKELELNNPELTEDDLISAMIENPILIERPIVIKNGKAIIGRPPESVLEIL